MRSILHSVTQPRPRLQLLAMVWVALFVVAAAWRLWGGVHFSRLMVSFGTVTDSAPVSMVLFTRTSTGELLELAPDEVWSTVWSRYKRFPAIRSVVAGWYDATDVADALPEVRAGLNWDTSYRLPVQRISTGPSSEQGLRSFAVVAEYLPTAGVESRLTSMTGMMNWQGDGFLLAIAAAQALAGTLLLWLIWHVLQVTGSTEVVTDARGQRISRASVPLEMLRLILLVLFGHQCWVFLYRTVSLSSAESTLIGTLLVPLPGLLIFFWVRGLGTCAEPRRVILRMVLLTIAVSMVKVLWLTGLEFRPTGDYEAFLRMGSLAAEGRWEEIGLDRGYLAFIYLRRAIFCVTPVVCCFGIGMWKIELVNVLVQAVSALLVSELVRRMFSLRTAACTLPILLLYPDFFYSSGMVSHNIWGYFWIALAWLIYDEFQRRLAAERSGNNAWLLQLMPAVCFGVAFGCSCTAIEFLKSYGVFMLAGAAIHLALRPTLLRLLSAAPTHANPLASVRLTFFLIAVLVCGICVSGLDRRLTQLTGLKMPPQHTLEYFATMSANGFEEGHNVTVWANDYARSVQGTSRVGVLLRQLLFEKVANAQAFLGSLRRKNSLLAFGSDAMVLTQDNAAGDSRTRRIVNFSTGGIQYIVCEASVCLLFLLCLTRLLSLHRLPLSAAELFPLLTTGVVLTFIYLLAEAHPYYSQNFGYPCSWSAGLVISMMRRQPPRGDTLVPDVQFNLFKPRMATATAVIGIVVTVYLLAGAWFDRSGLTFHRIREIQGSCLTNGPGFVAGEVSVSRTTGSLTLRSREAIVPAGVRATASFEVISGGGALRGLRFFNSGNQQSEGRRVAENWGRLPVRYMVQIEGKGVRSGFITDLRQARLIELPAEYWTSDGAKAVASDRVRITLSLETTAEFRWLRSGPDPAVAVEYFN